MHAYFLKAVKSNYDGNRKCGFEHADLLLSSFIGRRANRMQSLAHYAESKRAWVAYCNEKIATCEKKLARLNGDLSSVLEIEQTENKIPDSKKLDSVLSEIQVYESTQQRLSSLRDSCNKRAISARTRLARMHEHISAHTKNRDTRAEEWKNAVMEWGNVSLLQASAHMDNGLAIANGKLCSARSLIESGAVSAGAAELLSASKKYFSAGQPSKGISLGKEAAELLKKGSWDKVAAAYLEIAQLAESAGMFGEAMDLYALVELHVPFHSADIRKSLTDCKKRCGEKISRQIDDSMKALEQKKRVFFSQNNQFF